MRLVACHALACLAVASIAAFPAHAQGAFNVDNAAAVEGLFRGAAVRCASPEFAQRFVDVSKALVAFSLQGEGPIDTAQIEDAIARHANDPRFDRLNKDKMCGDMLPKLEALYKNRLASLQEAQRAADALRDLAGNEPVLP